LKLTQIKGNEQSKNFTDLGLSYRE